MYGILKQGNDCVFMCMWLHSAVRMAIAAFVFVAFVVVVIVYLLLYYYYYLLLLLLLALLTMPMFGIPYFYCWVMCCNSQLGQHII